MTPQDLLVHADALMVKPGSDVDLRRATSAYYYALFHLITTAAATRLIGEGTTELHTMVRRSFDHRSVRRVCEGLLTSGQGRSRFIEDAMPAVIPTSLLKTASAFVDLQVARLDADYLLEVPQSPGVAQSCQSLAHEAFAQWALVRGDPAGYAFLVALHLADRLTRRG